MLIPGKITAQKVRQMEPCCLYVGLYLRGLCKRSRKKSRNWKRGSWIWFFATYSFSIHWNKRDRKEIMLYSKANGPGKYGLEITGFPLSTLSLLPDNPRELTAFIHQTASLLWCLKTCCLFKESSRGHLNPVTHSHLFSPTVKENFSSVRHGIAGWC